MGKKLALRYDNWLYLALQLGMSIDEVMKKHTDRQLLVWNAWFDLQWNRPDKHDYYLMQIARDILRTGFKGVKDHKSIESLEALRIRFTTGIQDISDLSPRKEPSQTYKEQVSAMSIGRDIARMGGTVRVRKRLPDGTFEELDTITIGNKQSKSNTEDCDKR